MISSWQYDLVEKCFHISDNRIFMFSDKDINYDDKYLRLFAVKIVQIKMNHVQCQTLFVRERRSRSILYFSLTWIILYSDEVWRRLSISSYETTFIIDREFVYMRKIFAWLCSVSEHHGIRSVIRWLKQSSDYYHEIWSWYGPCTMSYSSLTICHE